MSNSLGTDQWLGSGTGDNIFSTVILNVDEYESYCEASFCAFENDPNLPSLHGRFKLDKSKAEQTVEVSLVPFSPRTASPVVGKNFGVEWPNVELSFTAKLELSFDSENLRIRWITGAGRNGKCELRSAKYCLNNDPKIPAKGVSWKEFKQEIESFPYQQFVFRGQPKGWPITTSFHRTNRKDLIKYTNEDIPILKRVLYPFIDQAFDDGNPSHNAAMYHLLQHYGYPTPMVDWTNSPYIAAYFAFQKDSVELSGTWSPKIFVFNRRLWEAHMANMDYITFTTPHVSMIDVVPIKNQRSAVQQGVSMYTNCFDVEGYIKFAEGQKEVSYLEAFEICEPDSSVVIDDLRKMGITPSSLFPGIDSTCRSIKEMRFT